MGRALAVGRCSGNQVGHPLTTDLQQYLIYPVGEPAANKAGRSPRGRTGTVPSA